HTPDGAIPEAEVAFPVFQISLGRNSQGKLFSGIALEQGQRQGACWSGNQTADRNHSRAAIDLIKHTTILRAFNYGLERVLCCRKWLCCQGHASIKISNKC